jgi:hypothetical protein
MSSQTPSVKYNVVKQGHGIALKSKVLRKKKATSCGHPESSKKPVGKN